GLPRHLEHERAAGGGRRLLGLQGQGLRAGSGGAHDEDERGNRDLHECVSSPRASRSARSLARPAARLFFTSAARPRNGTARPSASWTRRSLQASSNSTPVIDVSTSMRRGGRPIWMTWSGRPRSARETPIALTGAPNETNAS